MTYHPDEERIFHIARKLPDAQSVEEYLDQVCANDQSLRGRVEVEISIENGPGSG